MSNMQLMEDVVAENERLMRENESLLAQLADIEECIQKLGSVSTSLGDLIAEGLEICTL